jgi:uncharacterized protein
MTTLYKGEVMNGMYGNRGMQNNGNFSNMNNRNNNNQRSRDMQPYTNMMLVITGGCNLRCSYCYEQGDGYDNNNKMSFETAKKAVDMFFRQIPSNVERTSITFFGGEPHLNFELIVKVINYTYEHRTIGEYKGKGYNYVVNTNGTILTDNMFDLYKKLGKKINIRISVDGYKEDQDMSRKTINGESSWIMLEKNLLRYRELREKYGVQVSLITTINKNTYKHLYENHTKIYDFCKLPIGNLFVHEDNWTSEDFEIIKEQTGKLHDYCIERNIMLSLCNVRSNRNEGNSTRRNICSAGVNSFTVDEKGEIFPCHRCYFNDLGESYKLGNVDKGISKARRKLMWEINNFDMLPQKCRECNPVIRDKCHVCITTNKKVYGDAHSIPSAYCMFQKELYYMLLEKEMEASELKDRKNISRKVTV